MIRLSIADRLRLERMIEQGIDLDELSARRVGQNLQGFQENAERVHQMVSERLVEAEQVIGDLHRDLEAIPFLEAEQLQCDHLERAIAPLEEIQVGLHEKLKDGERELRILEKNIGILRATSQQLNKSLQDAQGRYAFEKPLNNAGSMFCMSIAKPKTNK